ncbi:sulfotransferase [Candidatus Uabimicrobium sp. HlEnr_7]|uniref:sulfotransferase family protein n=1 Tax=Candidatus Uabimicrobium helgolandensis TaxID=3095367 RepID=UPI0035582B2A
MIQNPIFIVGCSRSGTCMLGEVLKKHPHIHCLIEYPTTFKYSQYLCFHSEIHNDLLTRKHVKYLYNNAWKKTWRKCQKCSSGCQKIQYRRHGIFSPCYIPVNIKRYADKSHSNLINVNLLREVFPQSQFLHIYRDARDVVTSMLHYDRLTRRFSTKIKVGKDSSWPQPWYGIESKKHFFEWQEWSLAKKMAHAWESRIQQAKKHQKNFSKSSWLDICYENLLEQPATTTQKIFEFLELDYFPQTHSHIYKENSAKWQSFLQPQQLSDILENSPSLHDLGYLP